MGSANLSSIKRRMKSIKNTIKITKAMGVVANSKMRKCKLKLYSNNEFHKSMKDTMNKLLSNEEFDSNYMKARKSKKDLYIVLSSDMGLCGGYNNGIFTEIEQDIKNNEEKPYILVCGQKGRDYFRRRKYETIAEFVEISEIATLNESKMVLRKIISTYNSEDIGRVNIVYCKYVTPIEKKVVIEKLLPFNIEDNNKYEKNTNEVIEISNNIDCDELVEYYLSQKILNCMLNSRMCEQSFRIEATNNATKNGNELIDKLKIKYNRIRQSSITNEICEIIGGSEALK